MYLITDKAAKKIFETGIGLPGSTRGSKSLLRSSNKEIDLEEVEPSRFNIELGP